MATDYIPAEIAFCVIPVKTGIHGLGTLGVGFPFSPE